MSSRWDSVAADAGVSPFWKVSAIPTAPAPLFQNSRSRPNPGTGGPKRGQNATVRGILRSAPPSVTILPGGAARSAIRCLRDHAGVPARRTENPLRRSSGPAQRAVPRRPIHHGRYRPLRVRTVFHRKPLVPGPSTRVGGRTRPVELPDLVWHDRHRHPLAFAEGDGQSTKAAAQAGPDLQDVRHDCSISEIARKPAG